MSNTARADYQNLAFSIAWYLACDHVRIHLCPNTTGGCKTRSHVCIRLRLVPGRTRVQVRKYVYFYESSYRVPLERGRVRLRGGLVPRRLGRVSIIYRPKKSEVTIVAMLESDVQRDLWDPAPAIGVPRTRSRVSRRSGLISTLSRDVGSQVEAKKRIRPWRVQ